MFAELTPREAIEAWARHLAELPEIERPLVAHRDWAKLPRDVQELLGYDWTWWARPEQLPPPGDWRVWLLKAGRGAGKTRSAAEWFHSRMKDGKFAMGALVAPTPADARDFMVEGSSGLLNVGHPSERPIYESSKRKLTWPCGAEALVYSAEDPDQIRGPNVGTGWASEVGAWPRLKAEAAWSNLELCLRVGSDPRMVVDTTPRRGSKVLKAIVEDSGTVITTSSTYANAANLAPAFLEAIKRKYEGTALGRQELLGQDIEEAEGALWRYDMIQHVDTIPPEVALIAIGVDPSGSATGDEAGIVAVGTNKTRDRGWVIRDVSGKLSPDQWAARAVHLWEELDADAIVVERNFGGDMCRSTIEKQVELLGTKRPHIVEVTASRGKRIRAEPVAMLAEQGRMFHLPGLEVLEAELCGWDATDGSPSPGRMDGMCWAATYLMLGKQIGPAVW